MKIIKKLSEYIEEELEGAEDYAKCALKYKDEDMMMAKMFFDMSVDELRHVNMIHEHVVRLINEYRAKGEVIPEAMQSVYDYLHEKHIEEANKIKMYQAQYKN